MFLELTLFISISTAYVPVIIPSVTKITVKYVSPNSLKATSYVNRTQLPVLCSLNASLWTFSSF